MSYFKTRQFAARIVRTLARLLRTVNHLKFVNSQHLIKLEVDPLIYWAFSPELKTQFYHPQEHRLCLLFYILFIPDH